MVAVASIISMSPEVILMDEPNSSLDSRNRLRLIRLINDLDLALIIASQDLEFLLETCSRVALMDEGRICGVGPIRDILSNQELLEEHGLEKPHYLVPHTAGSQRHAPRKPRQKTVRFVAIPPDGY